MRLSRFGLMVIALFSVSACTSTHMSRVEYEGAGVPGGTEPKIGQVIVSDQRGTDSNWLGAIRGGYGNRLKTLRTERSTDIIVDEMYTAALEKSGLYSSEDDMPYRLDVTLTKFDCSYYFNREAHAHVQVALVENSGSKEVFTKTYKSDLTEGGVGAGIFGDPDTLRDLGEKAMNETIDKMLADAEFHEVLARSPSSTAVGSQVDSVRERLGRVQTLYEGGAISEEEYQRMRKSILSEI